MFGWPGIGWVPTCPKCPRPMFADHADGQGNYFCKVHYLIFVKGYTECMGCLGTKIPHCNGLPVKSPKPMKCNLCNGEGVLAP